MTPLSRDGLPKVGNTPYILQSCSVLWRYSPGRYSPAYWANSSDRVHFSHIGFPLLGDDLYGGSLDDGIQRQALHCHYLSFYHPFLEQDLHQKAPCRMISAILLLSYQLILFKKLI